MIKFFRKIRQKLITQNSFSKYFLYAGGEIVLVVLGILIALSLNNWNENQKSKVQELYVLENFRKSLIIDSLYIQRNIETNNLAKSSMEYLIGYMETDLPYKDSLKIHFHNITFDFGLRFDFSSYEELKSNGTNIISNESLRSNIVNYYSYAEGFGLDLSQRYSRIIDNASRTIFPRHFDKMWDSEWKNGKLLSGGMIPEDYQRLKEDKSFMFFLKTLKNQNYWLIEEPTINVNAKFIKILSEIDKEILKLKNGSSKIE